MTTIDERTQIDSGDVSIRSGCSLTPGDRGRIVGGLRQHAVSVVRDLSCRARPATTRRRTCSAVRSTSSTGPAERRAAARQRPDREYLEPALRERGLVVRVPMNGLRQGQQLAWLDACLHG